jgi:CrcB protein
VTRNGFIVVAIGAVLGVWSRWELSLLFNALWPSLPPGTLIANLVGAYLIGFFVELFSLRRAIPPEAALLVNTGYMGALTTFSTFSAEAVALASQGQYIWFFCHIASHLVGSLIMTVLGILTLGGCGHDDGSIASYLHAPRAASPW